jgi:hypothetical protein
VRSTRSLSLMLSHAPFEVDGGVAASCVDHANLFLAIGVLSAPEYVHRRTVIRSTWMSLLKDSRKAATSYSAGQVCAQFVVRALHMPSQIQQQLGVEQREYGDVLGVSVQWNETRKRGPILTLAAWIVHAAHHLRAARYVAKVDDDSYVHATGLAEMLRAAGWLPHERVYAGPHTWYSWYARKWDRCGFGWNWPRAELAGKYCRNATWSASRCEDGCGPSVGPFPFAAGYLIVLSQPLAHAIATSTSLASETATLMATDRLVTHRGFQHNQIFEDVWLGSFVHRFLAPGPPIAYLQLFRSDTIVDLDSTQWGSTVRPTALLVHIRSKEPRIFLAVHDFLNATGGRCRAVAASKRRLQCAHGCRAFGVPRRAPSARLCSPTATPPSPPSSGGAAGVGSSSPQELLSSATCTLKIIGVGAGPGAVSPDSSCEPQNLKRQVKGRSCRERETELRRVSNALLSSVKGGRENRPRPMSFGRRLAQWGRGGAEGRGGRGGRGGGGGGGGGGAGRGWRTAGNHLQALVHVAQLNDDGSLRIPADGPTKVVLEVGANSRNTLDRELLPLEPTVFLVSFEPLLDKYASLLARNSRPDTLSPLGHLHKRGVVLPFAISADDNAVRELKISGSTDGCASLLDPVSSYYSPSCTNTSGILERRLVPAVSLQRVLRTWLRGRHVELAKIDAQGLDVGVVRSAGSEIGRLRAVQLEVVRDRPPLKCTPQYASEPGLPTEAKCGVLVAAMAELGFHPYGTNCAAHKFKEAGGCEAEMMFVRDSFDERLVRAYCTSQKPHSCGPGAWSLPADRRGWDEDLKRWAQEEAQKWPPEATPPPTSSAARAGRGHHHRRAGTRPGAGRGRRGARAASVPPTAGRSLLDSLET